MNRNRRWKKHARRPEADRPRGSPGLEDDSTKPRPDLLVFGYASRIFKDNERATFFDKGRHLIPWMGNEALLIDRYDARGHLHSLQPPDANRLPDGTLVGAELYGDPQFEELCDGERYRDLRDIEEQQQMMVKQRHEVEMEEDYLAAIASPVPPEDVEAPQNGSYGAVGFSYNSTPSGPAESKEVVKEEEKEIEPVSTTGLKDGVKVTVEAVEETPFVPRSDFDIPAHISLPQFERIHAIIEKTAFFIADKGPQLEIVIRSKQANNESFAFLQPKDALYPYYRFLVEAIKSTTYKPSEKPEKEPTPPKEDIKEEPAETSSDEEDDYQTSLFSRLPTVKPKEVALPPPRPAVAFPQMASGPSIYGSLIQKVQAGLSKPSMEKVKEQSPVSPLTVKSFSIARAAPKSTGVNGTPSIGSPLGAYGTDHNEYERGVDGTDPSRFLPSTVGRSSKSVSRPSSSGPPPEVVTAVDKIANYVIKNGESFEEMIKGRHGPDDPKFGFVHGYHPYHGLYMERKEALLDAFRHTLRYSKSIAEHTVQNRPIKEEIQTDSTQKKDSVISLPPEVNKSEVAVPPPLPSYATPIEIDPRIAELKKKALEASLKVKQKIEEKEALRVSLVQKALEETKKLAKEAVENEDEEVKVVMNTNRVVAGSFFELIHDETGKKKEEKKMRSRSRSRERRRSRSREEGRKSKKERRRRSSSEEKDRSSRHKDKKHEKNGTSARKRRSRSREDSEERERTRKKLKHRRDRRSRSRS